MNGLQMDPESILADSFQDTEIPVNKIEKLIEISSERVLKLQ